MAHCVVVVPGIMGSVLERDGQVVWPGKVVGLLGRFGDMEALLAADLAPTDLIRRYFISTQYQKLLDDLEGWGFHERSRPPTLYPCPYDWRRRNEASAETLADLLDRVVDDHDTRGRVAKPEVTLIGHSMGGLVCRHYLESGRFEGRPGLGAVKLLVTLGTPHRGAPEALPVILGQQRRLWLVPEQVRRLAGDPRYTSAYQLLPHRDEPFAWDDEPGKRFSPMDIFEDGVASLLGLEPGGLAAAVAFHESLGAPPRGVRYFCFCGTRQDTTSLVKVRRTSAKSADLTTVEPGDSGDGTVPDWSAKLPRAQSLAVGGEHGTLYKNGDVRKNLAVLLGVDRRLRAAEVWPPMELALRAQVVEPGARVRGVLSFPASGRLLGELRVERARDTGGGAPPELTPVPGAEAIDYSGPTTDSLGIVLLAPRSRGAYRVSFYPAQEDEPAASDELFVVDP